MSKSAANLQKIRRLVRVQDHLVSIKHRDTKFRDFLSEK